MASRRLLVAIVLLAAALHAIGMARSILPAQDGLKFIRIAREFQTRPWIDVVRGADQHPLYPALVAVAEPVVSRLPGRRARDLAGRGPVGLRDRRGRPALPPLRPDPRPLRRADRHPRGGHLRPAPPAGRGRARHARATAWRSSASCRRSAWARSALHSRGWHASAGLRARGRPGIPGASGGPGRPRGGLPRLGDAMVATRLAGLLPSRRRAPHPPSGHPLPGGEGIVELDAVSPAGSRRSRSRSWRRSAAMR